MDKGVIVIVAFLAALLEICAARPAWSAQLPEATEYQVKAAYLYNFAKFIEWPPGSFADRRAPIVFGVLGEDPFGEALDLLRGKGVHGRPVVVRRGDGLEELAGCHVLFIAASEEGRLGSLLERLGKSPVLTVGDTDLFARRGGMIQFVTAGSRVRFAVNPQVLRRVGLKASSRLLELAEVVLSDVQGEDRR